MKTQPLPRPLWEEDRLDDGGVGWLFWPAWGLIALITLYTLVLSFYFSGVGPALLPALGQALVLRRKSWVLGAVWGWVALVAVLISPVGFGKGLYYALLAGTPPHNEWQTAANRALYDLAGFDFFNMTLLLGLTLLMVAIVQWLALRGVAARRDACAFGAWVAAYLLAVPLVLLLNIFPLYRLGVMLPVLIALSIAAGWIAVTIVVLRWLLLPAR